MNKKDKFKQDMIERLRELDTQLEHGDKKVVTQMAGKTQAVWTRALQGGTTITTLKKLYVAATNILNERLQVPIVKVTGEENRVRSLG